MRHVVLGVLIVLTVLALAGAMPQAAAHAQGSCGSTVMMTYGDTLIDIAERCDISVVALLDANPEITNTGAIPTGYQLRVPTDGEHAGSVYVVKPGDTLFGIASRFDTTITALMDANPEIINPALIYVGQRLTIPGAERGEPRVHISPGSSPAGTLVQMDVTGFPANARVVIGVGRRDSEPTREVPAYTDDAGEIHTQIEIPASARQGEPWVVMVHTPDFGVKVVSNTFIVAGDQSGEPLVRLEQWRLQRGATGRVIVTGFPPNAEVIIGVGKKNAEPARIYEQRTDAHGVLVTDVTVPKNAEPGPWVILARAPAHNVSATSKTYFISE